MSNWFSALAQSVQTALGSAHVLSADAGRLLLSPYGARAIALELPGVADNCFFHNPLALDAGWLREHRAHLTGLLGGDRLWIAPEVAYFWTDLQIARRDPLQAGIVQADQDAGDYRITLQDASQLELTAQMTLTDYRLHKQISLRARRQFCLSPRPCELDAKLAEQLTSFSFTITNELTLLDAEPGTVAGAWDLLQLPTTGTLICPTLAGPTEPRSYYNDFGPRHVVSNAACVRFLVDARHRIKMGLSPAQTTGRMGYHRALDNGQAVLIVRFFPVLPGEPYVDVPRASTEFFGGDVLQAYNDDGNFADFGEMEYHDPALVAGHAPASRSGTSVTHVLAGPDELVRQAGATLLGVAVEPL